MGMAQNGAKKITGAGSEGRFPRTPEVTTEHRLLGDNSQGNALPAAGTQIGALERGVLSRRNAPVTWRILL